jgi:hypothetical protein
LTDPTLSECRAVCPHGRAEHNALQGDMKLKQFGPFRVEVQNGQVQLVFDHVGLEEQIRTGEQPQVVSAYLRQIAESLDAQ